jgi:hypothetical protein
MAVYTAGQGITIFALQLCKIGRMNPACAVRWPILHKCMGHSAVDATGSGRDMVSIRVTAPHQMQLCNLAVTTSAWW